MTNIPVSRTVLDHLSSISLRNNQGQTLKPFELAKDVHRLGRDPKKADLIVPEKDNWMMVSGCQASFVKEGNNYRIYDGDQVKSSSNRLFFNNSLITPKQGLLLQDGMVVTVGTLARNHIIITYSHTNANQPSKKKNKKQLFLLKINLFLLGETLKLIYP